MTQRIEYEMDEEDEGFLEVLQKDFGLSPASLNDDKFENVIDRLEKKVLARPALTFSPLRSSLSSLLTQL